MRTKKASAAPRASDVRCGVEQALEAAEILYNSSSMEANLKAVVVEAAVRAYARTPAGRRRLAALGRKLRCK